MFRVKRTNIPGKSLFIPAFTLDDSAQLPFRFERLEDAIAKADKLARENPGIRYLVLTDCYFVQSETRTETISELISGTLF